MSFGGDIESVGPRGPELCLLQALVSLHCGNYPSGITKVNQTALSHVHV